MNKIEHILQAIKNDLLPVTKAGVEAGNHVFGGIILEAKTLETVVAGSNNRQLNPIYHGEIDTLQRFFKIKDHPAPCDCIFIASHDPCPMCISAIAWAGFREIWVLFDYQAVSDNFDMPVDLIMYKEIFDTEGARAENVFFKKYSIRQEAAKELNSAQLAGQINDIYNIYSSFKVQDFFYPGIEA